MVLPGHSGRKAAMGKKKKWADSWLLDFLTYDTWSEAAMGLKEPQVEQ